MENIISTNRFGFLDTEETIINMKQNPETLTVDQILKIRELELLEDLLQEVKYALEKGVE